MVLPKFLQDNNSSQKKGEENKKQEFIVLKYEDLFSRNTYTNTHKQNFKDLLIKLFDIPL